MGIKSRGNFRINFCTKTDCANTRACDRCIFHSNYRKKRRFSPFGWLFQFVIIAVGLTIAFCIGDGKEAWRNWRNNGEN